LIPDPEEQVHPLMRHESAHADEERLRRSLADGHGWGIDPGVEDMDTTPVDADIF
jgi:hypothetical protein